VTDVYVLDTSAIFTFTDQEDGSEEVESLLSLISGRCIDCGCSEIAQCNASPQRPRIGVVS